MNRIKDYGKLATDITAWIKNYTESNNLSSLVVGVSGGIDSAVVSTLCAMTELPVYCCSINIESSIQCKERAITHIEWLTHTNSNVEYRLRDLDDVYETLTTEIGDDNEHALANTKSRLRMMVLYHIACEYNGIVVGTGNKVEDFGIGFFTKYGDGGVDISPIADLYKTEVRELGRYLGISEEILNAVPTDGLWADNRTDEMQIQCTYEELEWAMEELSVYEDTHSDVFYTTDQVRILERYKELNRKNQHKMLPIPIFKLNQ